MLEDSNFTDINIDLNCRFTLDYEINFFIQTMFEKILNCMNNIKCQSLEVDKDGKSEIGKSIAVIKKFLIMLPDTKQLERALSEFELKMKSIKDSKIPAKIIRDAVTLKIILDLKIKLYQIIESPYFKV
jgi:hypothetical protein